MTHLIPQEIIEQKIFMIRDQKVMLSSHLAILYGVKPKVLMQAVKRNIERFPEEFMFQLTPDEITSLRSQIVTLNNGDSGRGKHPKYSPYAFTEHKRKRSDREYQLERSEHGEALRQMMVEEEKPRPRIGFRKQ